MNEVNIFHLLKRGGFPALLFSWPTHERAPVLEGADGPVYAVCPEEVPAPEEVIRLERVLQGLASSVRPVSGPKDALEA